MNERKKENENENENERIYDDSNVILCIQYEPNVSCKNNVNVNSDLSFDVRNEFINIY